MTRQRSFPSILAVGFAVLILFWHEWGLGLWILLERGHAKKTYDSNDTYGIMCKNRQIHAKVGTLYCTLPK